MADGLKNRGRSRNDMNERRVAVEDLTGTNLEHISNCSFDPEMASRNVENMIGVTQVPLGFAGPLRVNGEHAHGEFLVPMATTEGALVASVSRGCSIITSAGGADAIVVKNGMTRAPVFRATGIRQGAEAIRWVEGHLDEIRSVAESTTSHGRLLDIQPFQSGRSLYLRFVYDTGDAMGMNMITIATEAASMLIAERTGLEIVSVSGNVCADKKPAAINFINGRGRMVHSDITVPKGMVEKRLHTTVDAIVETGIRKNLTGGAISLSYGFNAHAANMIAAIYIATGQDPAQVVEGSMCMTSAENVEGDLYMSVRLPAIEVGTVGGGTRLPSQAEALRMMDCIGTGKASKLAEIVAATVLAGELSTLGAQTAGHLGRAHNDLGR